MRIQETWYATTTSRPRHHGIVWVPAARQTSAGSPAARQAKTTPVTAIRGTATRSAYPTARVPAATTAVASRPRPMVHAFSLAGPPHTRAQAEAAITLLSAIHAKFVT